MLKRFLLSPRTIVTLILSSGLFSIIGSLVPQFAEKPPRFFEAWKADSPILYYWIDLLQLNHVFTSVWFFTLVGLITLSLSLSLFYQLRTLMRTGGLVRREMRETSFKDFIVFEAGKDWAAATGGPGDKIRNVLKGRGYRLSQADEESGYFIFEKNRAGRWGSVFFHAGLLVVIVAALYVIAFHKKGFIQLAEADTFQGKKEDWRTMNLGLLAGDFHPGFQARLSKFTPRYWENGKIKNLESTLTVFDDRGQRTDLFLSLLNPAEFNGVKLYQSIYYGYSVELILERAGEEPVLTQFFLDAPDRINKPFAGGGADFPAKGFSVDMKLYPEFLAYSLSLVPPGVELTVTEKGVQRFKGMVMLNQTLQLGSDTLTFSRVRPWTGLTLSSNYATFLVYTGFALSTLGAFIIFMVSHKEIHVKIDEQDGCLKIFMGGRVKMYQAIFSEEFRGAAQMLEKELGAYGNSRTP